MRNIVFLLIVGCTGFMAYLWYQPVCQGGAIVKDEAACRATANFDAVFCRDVFARTAKIAGESGPAYASQTACSDRWPICDPHGPGNMQWGARPVAWCIVRNGAAATRIEPQYSRRG